MIHIVTGPPAAGKSTHIKTHRQPGDITIDYDDLANTIAALEPANHEHANHIKATTKAARQAAIDAAIKHHDGTFNIWIIHSTPAQSTLDKYTALGAEIHVIDPGKDIVMKRVKAERPAHMLKIAALWYADKPGPAKRKAGTTERGYGWNHQRIRQRLIYNHQDGTPCWWCGQPMYRDKAKNIDGLGLAADHTNPGGAKRGEPADRLLHYTCNSQRQDGAKDAERPVLKPRPEQAPPTGGATFEWA